MSGKPKTKPISASRGRWRLPYPISISTEGSYTFWSPVFETSSTSTSDLRGPKHGTQGILHDKLIFKRPRRYSPAVQHDVKGKARCLRCKLWPVQPTR